MSMSMSAASEPKPLDIKVDPWVPAFVNRLFTTRGVTVEAASETIGVQWDNWKRLLADCGLLQNQRAANDVAYAFAQTRVIGGPGRIFEHFAAFVRERPAAVREFYEERAAVTESYTCDICNGLGVVMREVIRPRDARRKRAAFACSCEIGKTRYGGIQMIDSTIADELAGESKKEFAQACQWLEDRGMSKRTSFWEFWRTLRLSMIPRRDARPETNDRRLGLEIYHNGDERGWFDENN